MKNENGAFIPFGLELINKLHFKNFTGNWYAVTYFVSHLIAQYTFEIKKLDYNKFMSEETKKMIYCMICLLGLKPTINNKI